MKKLMTILGAFLCVSLLLVSCGNEDDKKKEKVVVTPESEAKKVANECFCGLSKLDEKIRMMDDEGEGEKLKKEYAELQEKCDEMGNTLEDKYGDPSSQKDNEDSKKFWEALEAEVKKCM